MGGKNKEVASTEEAFRLLGEKLMAQSKVPNMYGYVPDPKQKTFHSSQARRRLYIGGNRSGKTTGGIIEDLQTVLKKHPFKDLESRWPEPLRGRVIGVDFLNGIQKIILPQVQQWVPASQLRGSSWSTAYDKLERVLHFENGGFIEFMSYDQDLDKFAGTSRHFIHFDEEPPQDIFNENMARLVDTGGDAWITMTPVDGMTWVYDTLYLPGVSGDSNISVVEVEMAENTHISPTEVEAYLSTLDEDEKKVRGQGKFVQLGGLIYKGYDKDIHVIDMPETGIPKDWLWCCSLDHGYNNPTAWLWHAVSPDDRVITFHEHYESGMTIDAHAAAVHKINAEFQRPPDFYVGDPSIRNTDPITGTSIHEEYSKYGIPIVLGNNDVQAGIVKVARYLKVRADEKPNLVITRNCTNLLREFPRYRWKTYANRKLIGQNNLMEQPHKKDDHALDSLRYFIMSRPDLTPDTAPQPGQVRNIMGATTAYAPGDRKAVTGLRNNSRPSDFTTDYGDVTEWELDEHLGAIY